MIEATVSKTRVRTCFYLSFSFSDGIQGLSIVKGDPVLSWPSAMTHVDGFLNVINYIFSWATVYELSVLLNPKSRMLRQLTELNYRLRLDIQRFIAGSGKEHKTTTFGAIGLQKMSVGHFSFEYLLKTSVNSTLNISYRSVTTLRCLSWSCNLTFPTVHSEGTVHKNVAACFPYQSLSVLQKSFSSWVSRSTSPDGTGTRWQKRCTGIGNWTLSWSITTAMKYLIWRKAIRFFKRSYQDFSNCDDIMEMIFTKRLACFIQVQTLQIVLLISYPVTPSHNSLEQMTSTQLLSLLTIVKFLQPFSPIMTTHSNRTPPIPSFNIGILS